jgi:hypothetical protein
MCCKEPSQTSQMYYMWTANSISRAKVVFVSLWPPRNFQNVVLAASIEREPNGDRIETQCNGTKRQCWQTGPECGIAAWQSANCCASRKWLVSLNCGASRKWLVSLAKCAKQTSPEMNLIPRSVVMCQTLASPASFRLVNTVALNILVRKLYTTILPADYRACGTAKRHLARRLSNVQKDRLHKDIDVMHICV